MRARSGVLGLLVLSLLLGLFLGACQSPSAEEQALMRDVEGEERPRGPEDGLLRLPLLEGQVRSLDPLAIESATELLIYRQLWRGLAYLTEGEEAGIKAQLASSIQTSDAGLSWQIDLDPEARWSDGQPIRAADLLRSWQERLRILEEAKAAGQRLNLMAERALGPLIQAEFHYGEEAQRDQKEPLEAQEDTPPRVRVAEGGRRILVQFPKAQPSFDKLLTWPVYDPQPPAEGLYSAAFCVEGQVPRDAAGWAQTGELRLRPNPQTAGNSSIKGLNFYVYKQSEQAWEAYRQGKLALIGEPLCPLPQQQKSQLAGYPGFRNQSSLFFSALYFPQGQSGPLADWTDLPELLLAATERERLGPSTRHDASQPYGGTESLTLEAKKALEARFAEGLELRNLKVEKLEPLLVFSPSEETGFLETRAVVKDWMSRYRLPIHLQQREGLRASPWDSRSAAGEQAWALRLELALFGPAEAEPQAYDEELTAGRLLPLLQLSQAQCVQPWLDLGGEGPRGLLDFARCSFR